MLINILGTIGLAVLILIGIIIVTFLLFIAVAMISSGIKYIAGGGKANGRKDN